MGVVPCILWWGYLVFYGGGTLYSMVVVPCILWWWYLVLYGGGTLYSMVVVPCILWWWYLVLSCSAGEDVPRSDEVRALVKDIWDLRVAKLRKSVNIMVLQQETYAKVC